MHGWEPVEEGFGRGRASKTRSAIIPLADHPRATLGSPVPADLCSRAGKFLAVHFCSARGNAEQTNGA
jgi:hypothetical protein